MIKVTWRNAGVTQSITLPPNVWREVLKALTASTSTGQNGTPEAAKTELPEIDGWETGAMCC